MFESGRGYLQAKTIRGKKPAATDEEALAALNSNKDVQAILSALPVKHASQKAHLRTLHREQFSHWHFLLRQGFSLLFYGYGSKTGLLSELVKEQLTDGGVLEVNGLAPALSARQVLIRASAMLRKTSVYQDRGSDTEALLRQLQDAGPLPRLYIMLHHIDGPGLRSREAQATLADLAACPCISLLASFEHVNTPLLWDGELTAAFNWLFFDITSFQPYTGQAVGLPPLLASARRADGTKSAAVVLRTLVPAAAKIFRILAEHQLADEDEAGITFAHLFRRCREKFLVTNEVALRSHLTEFRDHCLVSTRRNVDGADELYIPLDHGELQQLWTTCNPQLLQALLGRTIKHAEAFELATSGSMCGRPC